MAYSSFYADGTVTVAAGATALTGTGTAWVTAGVLPGSLIFIAGQSRPLPVRSVTAEGAITLDMPAPVAAAGAGYILLKLAYDAALTDLISRLLSQQTKAFDLDGADKSLSLVTDGGGIWVNFAAETGSATARWRIGCTTGDLNTLHLQRSADGSAFADVLTFARSTGVISASTVTMSGGLTSGPVSATGEVRSSSVTYPKFVYNSFGNPVDAKKWQSFVDPNGNLHFAILNDAENVSGDILTVSKSGTIRAYGVIGVASYTRTTLPSASVSGAGAMAWVSNPASGVARAFWSNGSSWADSANVAP